MGGGTCPTVPVPLMDDSLVGWRQIIVRFVKKKLKFDFDVSHTYKLYFIF